jgi:hypothetical protein
MMRSALAAFAAFWLAALLLCVVEAESFGRYGVAFAPRSRNIVQHSNLLIDIRGGATLSNDESEDEESEDEEEEESEEEEEEEEFDAVLAASTAKAAAKAKAKKAAASKKAMNAKLASAAPKATATKKPKKKKTSILKMLHVPYIIGACLNPVTLFRMTIGFWASLFNLDYLQQVRRRRTMYALNIESLFCATQPQYHINFLN